MAFGRGAKRLPIGNANRLPGNKSLIASAGGSSALTAAGQRIQRGEAQQMRRLIQPWQSRAFAYYDLLGEIKYASQFYSRALANLELLPMIKNADGELEVTENPEAIAALERIQDPGGGRSGLLSSYGRLIFLTGECYLFVTKDDDGIEQWEFLSTDELRIQEGVYIRYRAPSLAATDYRPPSDDDWEPLDDKSAVAYRVWQKHPRYSMLADSTMQGVLDLCEELVLLTRAVRSRARSRLSGSGILFLSEDLSTPPVEAVGDEDPAEDPFLSELTNAMMQPIGDEGTASAVVPLVVRGPTDAIERGVRHLQIIDPTQLYPETGLRYECVKRIAIGLDMPPEVLLGLMDANHWTGWMIDEQTWKHHLQPKAQGLVDDLTSAYYRPYLRDQKVANWQDYCVGFDATAIINHPDRGKDAMDAYGARAIGKAALRKAKGFDETDAPDKEELAEMVGVATRDASLAWFGVPSIRGGTVETSPGVLESASPDGGVGGGDVPSTGGDVEAGPPATPTEVQDAPVKGSANGHGAAARLQGAAELAVYRAREVAGNRLKSLAKKDPELLKLLDGARAGQVAVKLGRDRVRALNVSEIDLVAGARDLIADALRMVDITDAEVVALIVSQIERHAAKTLYDDPPAPLTSSFENYLASVAVRT